MKIDSVTLYKLNMPLRQPWTTAYGSDDVIRTVVVKVITSDGMIGWGESSPLADPTYSPEYCDGVYAFGAKYIAPNLPGMEIQSAAELNEKFRFLKGNPFGKTAFDLAVWDLVSQEAKQPLWRFIGGKNKTFRNGSDFGFQKSVDILLEKITLKIKEGTPRVKLKFGPGWEMNVLREVRKHFPDMTFHIDCNSVYTLKDFPLFHEIDEMNLAMIEQPLTHDDLIDHSVLQKEIRTPVCLDESLTSPAKARKAVAIGACKYFNLKPARLGGLTNTLETVKIAEDAAMPCWIGGMLESGIGRRFLAALCSLEVCKYPADLWTPYVEFYTDVLAEPMEFAPDGSFTLDEIPGAGIKVDEKTLIELSEEKIEFNKQC